MLLYYHCNALKTAYIINATNIEFLLELNVTRDGQVNEPTISP